MSDERDDSWLDDWAEARREREEENRRLQADAYDDEHGDA